MRVLLLVAVFGVLAPWPSSADIPPGPGPSRGGCRCDTNSGAAGLLLAAPFVGVVRRRRR